MGGGGVNKHKQSSWKNQEIYEPRERGRDSERGGMRRYHYSEAITVTVIETKSRQITTREREIIIQR